jgi:hypothetical protein
MQELPDQYLDAEITRALKFKPVVTPLQKQAARERLLMRAAGQTMLSPLIVAEEQPVSFREHVHVFRDRTLRVLQILLLDSSMYERARCPSPRFYEYYNPHGRYTFTIIHLSA